MIVGTARHGLMRRMEDQHHTRSGRVLVHPPSNISRSFDSTGLRRLGATSRCSVTGLSVILDSLPPSAVGQTESRWLVLRLHMAPGRKTLSYHPWPEHLESQTAGHADRARDGSSMAMLIDRGRDNDREIKR